MLAPEAEREAIVSSVEQRMAELYLNQHGDSGESSERTIRVEHPPEQRDGFVEQKITTYVVKDEPS